MSKIIKLSSQNVKRLSAVEITPDGNLIVIGGKNGAGKSSVLDSIFYVLGGKDALPLKPVREGQENAEIVVDLGDLIVRRKFTAAGGTSLVVTNKDGAAYPSPQSILDKLVGKLSFDPLEFARNTDGQAETLRKMVGLDFSARDTERKTLYDERTAVNREAKALAANVQAKAEYPDLPADEVKVADILSEQQAAMEENQANAKKRAGLAEQLKAISQKEAEIVNIDAAIADLQQKKAAVLAELPALKKAAEQRGKFVTGLQDTDLAPFQKRAEEAEETNQKIRSNKARAALVAQFKAKEKKSDELTARLDAIDAEKTKAIAEAKYPIPGLSFDTDGTVLFNGIPLSQASSAEQTKISIAIGLALNPKLRVLLIRDGSLLDEESLGIVAEMAEKNDAQVWMERVSTGGEVSVIIEDGMVAQ